MMETDPRYYVQGVRTGDRKILAKTITLIESSLPSHQRVINDVLNGLLPYTGNSIRLGITGVPGVGKSTFIESLGLHLVDKGHRVELERWADAIMARVYSHALLEELRESCGVPVINGLSDFEHPCQTVTDLLTMREKLGALHGLRLAWIGDGNNVLHSLLIGCALVGISVAAACPDGYHPRREILERARALAEPGVTLEVVRDPEEAARGADVVYTDVWTSMGQEAEQLARIQAFRRYQVNAELMALANREAIFMHCLPAHRGDEVTNEVVDGPQSVVFDQAENRLHAQKALLALLIGP